MIKFILVWVLYQHNAFITIQAGAIEFDGADACALAGQWMQRHSPPADVQFTCFPKQWDGVMK